MAHEMKGEGTALLPSACAVSSVPATALFICFPACRTIILVPASETAPAYIVPLDALAIAFRDWIGDEAILHTGQWHVAFSPGESPAEAPGVDRDAFIFKIRGHLFSDTSAD